MKTVFHTANECQSRTLKYPSCRVQSMVNFVLGTLSVRLIFNLFRESVVISNARFSQSGAVGITDPPASIWVKSQRSTDARSRPIMLKRCIPFQTPPQCKFTIVDVTCFNTLNRVCLYSICSGSAWTGCQPTRRTRHASSSMVSTLTVSSW